MKVTHYRQENVHYDPLELFHDSDGQAIVVRYDQACHKGTCEWALIKWTVANGIYRLSRTKDSVKPDNVGKEGRC